MTRHSETGYPAASDWLLGAIRRNPEGALLVAAGCALLLRQTRHPSRSTDRIAESKRSGGGLSHAAEGATKYASELGEQAKQTAASYASSAAEYAGAARREASEQSERIVEQATSTVRSSFDRVLREQPLALALAGLAAGAAVAAALPASTLEKETLGPVGDQVTDAVQRVGEQVKEATAKAGDRLKREAEERGLTSEGVRDVASEVANAFGSSLAGSCSADQPSPGPARTSPPR